MKIARKSRKYYVGNVLGFSFYICADYSKFMRTSKNRKKALAILEKVRYAVITKTIEEKRRKESGSHGQH